MKRTDTNGKMYFLVFIFLLLFAYIIFTLYKVQIVRHDELYNKAKKEYTSIRVMERPRGEIFDYNGNLLVGNVHVMNISCDPSLTGNYEKCSAIASIFQEYIYTDYQKVMEQLQKREREVRNPETGEIEKVVNRHADIQRRVQWDRALELEREIDRLDALKKKQKKKDVPKLKDGLKFERGYIRTYPKGKMLSCVLGFLNQDDKDINKYVAELGLEKILDAEMKSEDSIIKYERATGGRRVTYSNSMMIQEGENGHDVYLTICEPIQAILEEELDRLYEETKAKVVYAVLVDPFTGNVLALAQRPTFDPNDRSVMKSEAYVNHLAVDAYEPGSIMKPFVVAWALDKGYVTPNTIFETGQGQWLYAGKILHDSHPMGTISVAEIIKQSSNIGTAKIAVMMGEEQLDNALRTFGFGKKTNLFSPETRGILRRREKWDSLSISRFCIGQGVSVSALQMARAYCMLANGGYPINLRIVDRIFDGSKETVMPINKFGKSVFERPETHQELLAMMKRITEPGGTAEIAAVPGYYVASKTGTSEKFINGAYRKKYVASFCGFIPADNPRFVLLLSCDEPKGPKQYGGSVAGPVFSTIAERVLKYMEVPLDVDLETWNAERTAIRKKVREQARKRLEEERLRRETKAKLQYNKYKKIR